MLCPVELQVRDRGSDATPYGLRNAIENCDPQRGNAVRAHLRFSARRVVARLLPRKPRRKVSAGGVSDFLSGPPEGNAADGPISRARVSTRSATHPPASHAQRAQDPSLPLRMTRALSEMNIAGPGLRRKAHECATLDGGPGNAPPNRLAPNRRCAQRVRESVAGIAGRLAAGGGAVYRPRQ